VNNAIDNALEAIRQANPVPDPVDLADAMLRSEVFLTTTKETMMSVDKDQSIHQTAADRPSRRRRNILALVGAFAVTVVAIALVAIVSTGNDTPQAGAPTSGPVTIETEPDFSTRPVAGTFEVTEGADILGCSNGTYVDTFDDVTADVTKLMTCSEPDTGTFTILFDPDGYDTGPGEQNGPWRILEGTGDLGGLQGEGDFWMGPDASGTEVETYTGDIEYTS